MVVGLDSAVAAAGEWGGGGFGGGPGGGGFGGRGGGLGAQGRGQRGQRNGQQGQFFGNRANRGRDNQLHGMAYVSLTNAALNARPFSLTGADTPEAAYAQTRIGLVLGGPLKALKIPKGENTSFFINYYATRAKNPYLGAATVPTLAERAGDFSQAPTTIYMPGTTTPFPSNIIPASLINTAATGLLPYIPLPNQPGSVQNYQLVTAYPNNTDNLSVRLNQNLTSKDRLALNIGMQRRETNPQQLFGWRDETSGFGINSSLTYTRTLGAHTLDSLAFNFNRNRSTTVPFFANGPDVAAELGISGTSNNPLNYGPPTLSFTNFGALTDSSPIKTAVQSQGVTESVSTTKGTHNLSIGTNYSRTMLNTDTDQNGRGTFTFTGFSTSAFNASGQPLPNTGYDFADYLLGLPQASSVRFGDSSTYFRGNVFGVYGQDDWRIRSTLSLNLGLRWEYYSPLTEKYGHIANLEIAPDYTAASVVTPGVSGPYGGVLPASLMLPDRHDIAPRVGVAWKPIPNKSLQFRASYGIYYNPTVYNSIASKLAGQPPFAETNSLTTSLGYVLTLQNGLATAPSNKQILNTYAVDPAYQIGYAQTWNAQVQTDVPGGLVLDVGYLGTKGSHLDILRIPNISAPGSSSLTSEENRMISNAVAFTYETSDGNSIYNALQVRLIRRFRKGVSFNAFYAYSKSIDDSSTFGGVGNTTAQNPFNLRLERGISSFNQPNVLNLNWVVSSPLTGRVLFRNWTFSGGMTAADSTPLTARVLGNQSNTGGTGVVGSGRAEATGLPVTDGTGFFNLGAFTIPVPGTLGDAARNTIPGPFTWSINAGVTRSWSLGERRRLEFRIDSTNLTNHVNITGFGTVVNASNYGLPLAASGMRQLTANLRFRF